MDAYRAQITAEAEGLLAQGLAQGLVAAQELLLGAFAVRQPSRIQSQQLAALTAELTATATATTGTTVVPSSALNVAVVTDHVELAIANLQKLALWISLLVPKVADGNNFGVEVQLIILKELRETIDKLQKAWDALPEYAQQRAAAMEKLRDRTSGERSVTTTATTTSGAAAKEGESGDKTVVARVDKTQTTANHGAQNTDALAHVVALDVKWHGNLARLLEAVRDAYVVTADRLDKNKDKILLPRGHERGGFSMY